MINVEQMARVGWDAMASYDRTIGAPEPRGFWDQATTQQQQDAIRRAQYLHERLVKGVRPSLPEIHQNWLMGKTNDGWKKGDFDAGSMTHPLVGVEYKDLPKDQQVRNAIFLAVVEGVYTSQAEPSEMPERKDPPTPMQTEDTSKPKDFETPQLPEGKKANDPLDQKLKKGK